MEGGLTSVVEEWRSSRELKQQQSVHLWDCPGLQARSRPQTKMRTRSDKCHTANVPQEETHLQLGGRVPGSSP